MKGVQRKKTSILQVQQALVSVTDPVRILGRETGHPDPLLLSSSL